MTDASVSILDVAAAAGVSKSTASRALLGSGDVSASTRAHVQVIADQIGYVKDFHAHALKSGVSRTVAIYVRSVQLGFYGELIAAVQSHLEAADYRLAVISASSSDRRPLETMLSLRPAAAIVASGRVPLDSFAAHRKIPIVLAGSAADAGSLSSVFDDGSGCEALAENVANRGHRRVAVVEVPATRSRTLAPRSMRMRAALAELGVSVTTISTGEDDDIPDAEELRRALADVTAVMCPNDPILIHTWNRLTEWGIRVPEDVSLTGYDGAGLIAAPAIGITTWEQPLAEIGRRVAIELLRRIGDADARPDCVALPGQLIPGRTLGAPALN